MSNELMKSQNIMMEIESAQKLCSQLMRTPHYSKLGESGIFAIVQKSKSIGMDPLDALNGGMYFVQGKVEMSGQSMLALIRSKGHSVSMDPKSTDIRVIMYGKRCDNGDTWRVEFSVEDAKRQGIYRGQWEKMPKVMCMWRCVSQLGRFLFSDVLKGVYVQGEISEAVGLDVNLNLDTGEILDTEVIEHPKISPDQVSILKNLESKLSQEYLDKLFSWMKLEKLEDLTEDKFERSLIAFENAVKYAEQQAEVTNA